MPVSSAFFTSHLATEPLASQIRNLWTLHGLPADFEVEMEHLPLLEAFGKDVPDDAPNRPLSVFFVKLLLELCENTSGKENKCKITSVIFPFMLRATDLLTFKRLVVTMINKLHEFKEETSLPEYQEKWKEWREALEAHFAKTWPGDDWKTCFSFPQIPKLMPEAPQLKSMTQVSPLGAYVKQLIEEIRRPNLSFEAYHSEEIAQIEGLTHRTTDGPGEMVWNGFSYTLQLAKGFVTIQNGQLNGPMEYKTPYHQKTTGAFRNGKPDGEWKVDLYTIQFKEGRVTSWASEATSVTIAWNEDGTINHRKCTKTGPYGVSSEVSFTREIRLYRVFNPEEDDNAIDNPDQDSVLVTYRVPVDAERVPFFIRGNEIAVSKAIVESLKTWGGKNVRRVGALTFQDVIVDKEFSNRFATRLSYGYDGEAAGMISGYLTAAEAVNAEE
jgi:hypothetical protein